ncbi:MAG: hypothetical protein K2O03_03670, partial [Lachnospiraceae bacterium]|nr:hypothetical protein [Lachnospiraceae bacterium]
MLNCIPTFISCGFAIPDFLFSASASNISRSFCTIFSVCAVFFVCITLSVRAAFSVCTVLFVRIMLSDCAAFSICTMPFLCTMLSVRAAFSDCTALRVPVSVFLFSCAVIPVSACPFLSFAASPFLVPSSCAIPAPILLSVFSAFSIFVLPAATPPVLRAFSDLYAFAFFSYFVSALAS